MAKKIRPRARVWRRSIGELLALSYACFAGITFIKARTFAAERYGEMPAKRHARQRPSELVNQNVKIVRLLKACMRL
ncbi:MAG: hypothetical protein ACRCYS_12275, partial [Beijerinckiaceae bacterium]